VRGYFAAHPGEFSVPLGARPGSGTKTPRAEWHHVSNPGDVLKVMMAKTTPESTRYGQQPHLVMPSLPKVEAGIVKNISRLVPSSSAQPLRPLTDSNAPLILPESFTFYRGGFADFDHVLKYFDWTPRDSLTIDLTACLKANFQAAALLV
jgi:hypothetical protein